MTDPIAAMFSQIKNGLNARQETVDVPHSRVKEALAKIMVAEGWLGRVEVLKRMDKRYLRLALKYKADRTGVISKIKRVSRPGRRIYQEYRANKPARGGFSTIIMTTSKGIMTDEEARASKIGGEVIGQIW